MRYAIKKVIGSSTFATVGERLGGDFNSMEEALAYATHKKITNFTIETWTDDLEQRVSVISICNS